MASSTAQLRKGTVELAVLALLARKDHYGGELVESLSSHSGLDASAGTIYPLLKRLSGSGVVSTSWVESPSGPPRKYYSLTTSGRNEFGQLRDAWRELTASLNTLLGADDD